MTQESEISSPSRRPYLLMLAAGAVVAVALWQVFFSPSDAAHAAKPLWDAAGQREVMVEETRKTNAKLDELLGLLRSGQVKVIAVQEQAQGTNTPKEATSAPSQGQTSETP